MNASRLLHWAPFKIDALGLITLLGVDDINRIIGRLCVSQITEFLPLVAGHVIANDSFKLTMLGFSVYNITDGIHATDIAGWFSRWLLCQRITYSSTTLTVGILPLSLSTRINLHGALVLGFAVLFSMISLAVLITDWWGLANAISLALSIIARFEILKANRNAIDRSADDVAQQHSAIVKTFWKLPNGSCLTIYTTRGILTECLLTSPKPASYKAYSSYRFVAWGAFLVHIICLGMAALPSQLLCVSILATSTIAALRRWGSNDEIIGTRIHICRIDNNCEGGSMAALFARLSLTKEEEEYMIDWKIMPMPNNFVWWAKYRHFLTDYNPKTFATWKINDTWVEFENKVQGMT